MVVSPSARRYITLSAEGIWGAAIYGDEGRGSERARAETGRKNGEDWQRTWEGKRERRGGVKCQSASPSMSLLSLPSSLPQPLAALFYPGEDENPVKPPESKQRQQQCKGRCNNITELKSNQQLREIIPFRSQ